MDVIFFPRNDYPSNVEICNHRLGKKMTMCECTTMIPPLVAQKLLPYVVGLNQSSNIRVSGFFDDRNAIDNYVLQQIEANVISPDVYFLSYPTSDYSQQAIVNSKNRLWTWFEGLFGRTPTAIVFGLVASNYGDYMKPYILSGQNDYIDNDTDYGVGVGNPNNVPYSINRYYTRNRNLRALDYAIIPSNNEDYPRFINWASDLIDETLTLPNGGFIISFNHWHNLLALDYNDDGTPKEGRNDYAINNGFKPYFDMLAEKNANDEIYFAGFSEAISYLVYRQSVKRVVMYSPSKTPNTKLIIRLETVNNLNINRNCFSVPISVKFSTIGTPLAGQSIKCIDKNLISLGNNQYIIEIPYSEYPGAVIEKVSI